ncbi:hypothetical protein BGW38_002138 [Lunasporangiospora selenospora]|uniref:Uncharacterized protein n=1 Tax=Lunasporangiospora selenospora TaxID=979761 RepID=A0A9P6FUM0_9FUNG|nr:hypothetical protein BGW38_002138 [Lunasporangiospora selenospora]
MSCTNTISKLKTRNSHHKNRRKYHCKCRHTDDHPHRTLPELSQGQYKSPIKTIHSEV